MKSNQVAYARSSNANVFCVNQSTTQTFRDLYVHNTLLILVKTGSKQVHCPNNTSLVINADELVIFPSDTFIAVENRILSGLNYTATCISYPDELVNKLFSHSTTTQTRDSAIRIASCPSGLISLIQNLKKISLSEYPNELVQHRLIEPLIWLKSLGLVLSTNYERTLLYKLRHLIASDLEYKWRSAEVAKMLGYSEATLRRKLNKLGTSFTNILINTRLEYSLTALQSTTKSISQISIESGFSTPSHFSDTFHSRFGFPPIKIRKN